MTAIAEAETTARHARTHMFYRSDDLAASAENAVSVDVSIETFDVDSLCRSITALIARRSGKGPDLSNPEVLREVLEAAAAEVFSRSFAEEFGQVITRYRQMLRESIARGDDPELQAALNRARLQERILAGTAMADQAEACELLGLSAVNASATMKRREDKQEVMRFTVDGRASYPLFQFDVEARRVHPVMAKLIAMKPDAWSDFRLLHWLTRPHLDFDGSPADALGADPKAVIAALGREVEPAVSG